MSHFFGKIPKINNIQNKNNYLDDKTVQKTNDVNLDDLIKKLLIEKPFDENKNNCRISWEDYFNHNFFKNNYEKVKEYYKNGKLRFDGEYLNGKR